MITIVILLLTSILSDQVSSDCILKAIYYLSDTEVINEIALKTQPTNFVSNISDHSETISSNELLDVKDIYEVNDVNSLRILYLKLKRNHENELQNLRSKFELREERLMTLLEKLSLKSSDIKPVSFNVSCAHDNSNLQTNHLQNKLDELYAKLSNIIQNTTDIYGKCRSKCSTIPVLEKMFDKLSSIAKQTTDFHGKFVTNIDFVKLFEKMSNSDQITTAALGNFVTQQNFTKLFEKLSNSSQDLAKVLEKVSHLDQTLNAVNCNCLTIDDFEKFSCSNKIYDKIQGNGRVRRKYLGCYQDPGHHRGLIEYALQSKSNNIDTCIDVCRRRNYIYAGLQSGYWCHCGNQMQHPNINKKLDESSCNFQCSGNTSELCGGAWANSIYETGIEQLLIDEEGHQLPLLFFKQNPHAYFKLQYDAHIDD